MAASDYALCDVCEGKAHYDADCDVADNVVVMHRECRDRREAEIRADERAKLADELHGLVHDPVALQYWLDAHGLRMLDDSVIAAAFNAVAADLDARLGGYTGRTDDWTVLDEATDVLDEHAEPGEGLVIGLQQAAALVLRVAEKRLRAYGYYDAANAVVEGIDDNPNRGPIGLVHSE